MNKQPVYRFDDFVVDPEAWCLSRDGQEIHLEPVVLKLLIYLIANRDRLVTRQELMNTVWGDTVISESALTKAVARLRKALDDDSAHPLYLETVRSRGYRFVATVEETERPEGVDSQLRQPSPRTARRALLVSAASMIALIALATFWFRMLPHKPSQEEVVHSLAVLPLKNLTGDPEHDYYVDGLQDLLITELSQFPGLRVTSRQSTLRYRDSQLPMADIAGELGVDALVEGSLFGEGTKIDVTIQLIDSWSDEHLWAERYTGEKPLVFNLIADIAEAIGTEITTTVPQGGDGLTHDRIGPVDPSAIDAYALGMTHLDRLTENEISNAIDQLEKAVAIEPNFAHAWSLLAGAHAMQALYGFAMPRDSIEIGRAAAMRAIEADAQVYSGHSALGWARLWTGDFNGACESFEVALRLNPSAPNAIHGDADCLLLEGRMDESIARLRDIVSISPFSAIHNMPLPYHLYLARRFDEAITAAEDMRMRIPQFSLHWFFAKNYWQQGLFDKALEEKRLEFERRGDTILLTALEEGLEAAGPRGAMRAIAQALVVRAGESYVDAFEIGETFARAGLVDEALQWLNKAVEHGSYKLTYLAIWPELDVLRDDPRYQDLVERVYGQKAQDIRRLESFNERND
ncbi:MAG: winged helix-turn-helix domain-containing protein [Gammaproteobacteria bacterium]|nr:winged helix-turn-helix domain-containing protein [Gammaproteobacteria bacterium]